MAKTLEEHIEEVQISTLATIASQHFPLPIQNQDGTHPIVVTIPDEPLLQCAQRAELLGEEVNLVIVTGNKMETCVLRVSHETTADANAIVLPDDSSYTVGQYLQDTRDLHRIHPVRAMGGLGLTTNHALETLATA